MRGTSISEDLALYLDLLTYSLYYNLVTVSRISTKYRTNKVSAALFQLASDYYSSSSQKPRRGFLLGLLIDKVITATIITLHKISFRSNC
jgi:hypothetical protein